MIITKGRWLTTGEVWFDSKPTNTDVDVILFEQRPQPLESATCTPFHTRIIDLSADAEHVMGAFSKNNRYKIRRGDREGLIYNYWSSPDPIKLTEFCDFYDRFAAQKSRSLVERNKLEAMIESGVLDISCIHGPKDEALVYHSHIKDCSRARLLHTVSLYREIDDSGYRNMIGRANRYLHWQDMLRFKTEGIGLYDVGGWYIGDTDEELLRINRFKAEFGGDTEVSYNCIQLLSAKAKFLFSADRLVRSAVTSFLPSSS